MDTQIQFITTMTDERIYELARFRESWQETAGESLIDAQASVGLILNDVCNALGFTWEERRLVLGNELLAEVDAWLDAPVLPTAKAIELTTERPEWPSVQ